MRRLDLDDFVRTVGRRSRELADEDLEMTGDEEGRTVSLKDS